MIVYDYQNLCLNDKEVIHAKTEDIAHRVCVKLNDLLEGNKKPSEIKTYWDIDKDQTAYLVRISNNLSIVLNGNVSHFMLSFGCTKIKAEDWFKRLEEK